MGTSKHFVLKVDMIETRMLPRTVLNEERAVGVGEQRMATVVRSNGAPEAQISESNAGPGRK